MSETSVHKITNKIRYHRVTKGFSQESMAEKLNISKVNYGNIERGQTKLTLDRLIEISDILEMPVEDFFTNVVNKKNEYYRLLSTMGDFAKLLENQIGKIALLISEFENCNSIVIDESKENQTLWDNLKGEVEVLMSTVDIMHDFNRKDSQV
ncbi:MAG: helix-turn-helix domain-containing protein [Bacteroidota bacterium]